MRSFTSINEGKPDRPLSFAQLYQEFIDFRPRRVSTLKLYDYSFRLFTDYLGSVSIDVEGITPSSIQNFVAWLEEKYSGNTGYVVFCVVKSIFKYAEKHYLIKVNPCNLVDARCRLRREHHHQALTDKQISVCEDDFWALLDNADSDKCISDMLTDTKSDSFFRMCFILGFYLQGLAFVDIVMLKTSYVTQRTASGTTMYVIETQRRKTGKKVKVVIPDTHARRYRLFSIIYEHASANGRTYLLPILEQVDGDEHCVYNKVNRLSCDMSRKLKQWWKRLNSSALNRHPIDTTLTSYYSCRHTFATLYLQNPNANLSELATLMGRNTEYIDTYIREIESDKTISEASDKVFGTKKKTERKGNELKQILSNLCDIKDTQDKIVEILKKQGVLF